MKRRKKADRNSTTYRTLKPEDIDSTSQWIADELTGAGASVSDVLRLRLSAEDVLGVWAEMLGADTECVCISQRKFRRFCILLRCPGKPANPCRETAGAAMVSDTPNMISALGMTTEYSYENGCNMLTIMCPKKTKKSVPLMLVAVVSAVILGFGLRLGLPSAGEAVQSTVISPVFSALLRVLSAISGPLVFLSVVSGILGVGNTKTLGTIGKKLIGSFMKHYAAVFALILLITVCVFPLSLGSESVGGDSFSKVFELFLNVIPSDIVSPFETGNALQIIFLAVITGIGVICLGSSVSALSTSLRQLNVVVQLIMASIGKTMPVFVFFSLMNLILGGSVTDLGTIVRPILLVAVTAAVWLSCNTILLARKRREPLSHVLKTISPPFLLAMATASSSACFQVSVDGCRQFDIDQNIINFGVPLGQILYKPGVFICYFYLVVSIGAANGISITPVWLIILGVLSMLLAAATPPVSGGAMSCLAILFTQMGLPETAMALAINYLIIVDYIDTPCNVTSLLETLAQCAGRVPEPDKHRADV